MQTQRLFMGAAHKSKHRDRLQIVANTCGGGGLLETPLAVPTYENFNKAI
ncbi:hypothetical protein [Gayadomonas joobiniege]|nr:hypothetical protein [Gayadomonas joobiniege]